MLNNWLRYSVRRKLLDDALEEFRNHMGGNVLEIGCGRAGRRGQFSPPVHESDSWTYVAIYDFIMSA